MFWVELCLSKKMLKFSPREPVNVTFGNRLFEDVIQLKSYWIRVDPNPMTGVLI